MILMATYGMWLKAQENRDDPVGAVARHWAELGIPKVHSPSGIRRHLEQRGELMEAGGPTWLGQALTAAEDEYRGSRGLQAAPEPAGSHPVARLASAAVDAQTQLDVLHRIEAKVNIVLVAMGIDPDEAVAAGMPSGYTEALEAASTELAGLGAPDGDETIDYDQLWMAADHSAAEAE